MQRFLGIFGMIVCRHCQSPLEGDTLRDGDDRPCPACGAPLATQETTIDFRVAEPPRTLGRFELLERVGAGGFGTVYRARDSRLDRIVAVKVPRMSHLTSAEECERFLREARNAAQLRHPLIVSMFEIGQADDLPYLVCEFIEGVSLSEWISQGRMAPRDAAALVAQVADALEYAHGLGVIHRDVKPANIMLQRVARPSPGGESASTSRANASTITSAAGIPVVDGMIPKVMDFGLARREGGDATLTTDGQVLGTPAYMSPEQARGEARHVDGRSDLYSLGVVLYQALTGEPPFRGTPRMQLDQVLHDEPRSPRSLCETIPRDLETICLKAMAKEPSGRYATASEMAADLRRFVAGEPILARPLGPVAKLARWCRRKPAKAAAVLVTVVAAAAVTGLSALMAVQQAHAARVLRAEQGRTQAALVRSQGLAGGLALERGLTLCEQGDSARGLLWMARGLELLPENDAVARVVRLNIDAWAQRMPRLRGLPTVQHRVAAEAFSLDGRTILLIGADGVTRRYDADTGRFVDDYFRHPGPVVAAFSADGRIAATVTTTNGSYQVWDALTGQPIGPLVAGREFVPNCSLSPDGRRLALLSGARTLRVMETSSGREAGPPIGSPGLVAAIAWSPDGSTLATASTDQRVRLWDIATGQPAGEPLVVTNEASAVAWSPDGRTIVTGDFDGAIRFWDAQTRQPDGAAIQLGSKLRSLSYSPDGRWVVAGSVDDLARVWDARTRALVGCPLEHRRPVNGAAFHPARALLLTRAGSDEVKLWGLDAAAQDRVVRRMRQKHALRELAFNRPVDRLLAAGGRFVPPRGELALWDLEPGTEPELIRYPGTEVFGAAFGPDDATFFTGGGLLDDAASRQEGRIARWSAASDEPLWTTDRLPAVIFSVACSPDGRLLLAGDAFGRVYRLDAATGQAVGPPWRHGPDRILAIAFSRDGRRVATASADHSVLLRDVATGQPIGPPLAHGNQVVKVTFSPDGRWLATGCMDDTARVWDVATGRLATRPMPQDQEVSCVAFSPDGQLLLTGSDDRRARLWDRASGWRVGPAMTHAFGLYAVAFHPDGQSFRTAAGRGETHEIEIGAGRVPVPVEGSRDQVRLYCEVVTGMQLDDADVVSILEPRAWQERSSRLHESAPTAGTPARP